MQCIPPTWRHFMIMTSVMSLHSVDLERGNSLVNEVMGDLPVRMPFNRFVSQFDRCNGHIKRIW